MAEKTDSQSTVKGQAAQSRMIAEALKLFASKGYHATSIREIAEGAGIAKATVYHYYPTKAAILYEIHNIFMTTLEEGMERMLNTMQDPRDLLRAIVHDLWRVMVSHRPHVQIFFEEWRYLNAEDVKVLQQRRDRYFRFLRETIADIVIDGSDDTSSSIIDVLTLAVFGMCNWAYQWFDPDGAMTATEIADRYAAMALAAIAPQRNRMETIGASSPFKPGSTARRIQA